MKITEHNVETGEIIEREMTPAEEESFLMAQSSFNDEQTLKEQNRQAILDKLGITMDELRAAISA
jgi:hypothetical protein